MARTKSPTGSKQKDSTTNIPAIAAQAAAADSSQRESRPASKKLEVVKAESYPNLLPMNLEDEIRRRAYELSERRGFAAGYETEDWLNAEREVRQRYRQQSA